MAVTCFFCDGLRLDDGVGSWMSLRSIGVLGELRLDDGVGFWIFRSSICLLDGLRQDDGVGCWTVLNAGLPDGVS